MSVLTTLWKPATIADGASLSGAVDITGHKVVALRQPASCEGTAFTMQASYDGGTTFEDLQTDAAEWSVTKSATVAQVIMPKEDLKVVGPTHIKVRTGTSAAATNQTGAATVWVSMIPVSDFAG